MLAEHGPQDAVYEPGRVGTAEALGRLDRLVDRALRWDRRLAGKLVGVEELGQPDPQDRPLERRDPLKRPP